jgi:hypothetical protein
VKLKTSFMPGRCRDCAMPTRLRVNGARYEMQEGELYAEELVGVPLCPFCIARSRWAVPEAWLIAIARREQKAKARHAEWVAAAEPQMETTVSSQLSDPLGSERGDING